MQRFKIFGLITALTVVSNCVNVFGQKAPAPYGALPTKAQLNWHEMEMYCIIHFGVDTYTDKEWGYGDEDPKLVNPAKFNASQIIGAAKAGGFKGAVVVAKHHDGLCLWPTATTEHNISKSNWRGGKGDMVKEYQLACQKLGMQLGLYCSPWDRNSAFYGTPEYVEIYRKQLKELYSRYGKLFISWHDGANGGDGYYGGTREVRKIDRTTYYGWDTTWAITRKMQPSAVIFGDIGADVRWVGNEEGYAGETCWATYDPVAPDPGKKPSNGYTKYELGIEGTRNGKHWMPAECDVSLRPGWFYHASQNSQVKTPYELLDLYYKSVGRGANLDLGLSPNRDGLLDPEDVTSLKQFGDILRKTFAVNLAKGATLKASNIRGNNAAKFGPQFLTDASRYSYWATDDAVKTPELVLNLKSNTTFNIIRLRENIKLGQRIEAIAVDAWQNGKWNQIATATSIGSNRLIRLPQNITTTKVRLRITKSPVCIALSDFGLYKEPVHLEKPKVTRDLKGNVTLTTNAPVSAIYYTTDGRTPTKASAIYKAGFPLKNGGVVKALAADGSQVSEVGVGEFGLNKEGWKITTDVPADQNNLNQVADENPNSFYYGGSNTNTDFTPSAITIDLGNSHPVSAITYLPRQDKKADGVVDQYSVSVSNDGTNWTQVASGEFSNIRANPVQQLVRFAQPANVRFVKFETKHVLAGNKIAVAELGVLTK
ncbi:alpha-L-fucosidase [Mucilaginibacter sp. RS28]|uniref:alpha-L-fucosidase n=1 Tax=Mucilaginibacter straminoryzae TaxID=2932774 RepID=A0A9X2BD12_9SPHI|nr:alpha-L-fucosidase [Mucilaginibacter straminoryzae]MCJ8209823.1 alpha-L-fucosidase [Mucilaginibacter straminoryzae]